MVNVLGEFGVLLDLGLCSGGCVCVRLGGCVCEWMDVLGGLRIKLDFGLCPGR